MKYLQFEKQDRIGVITLNRPDVLNALNHELLSELHEFLLERIPTENIEGLVVQGAGGKAFAAGADIEEMTHLDRRQCMTFSEHGQKAMNALENCPCITIAAVNGFALGGGFELALACDFIYASRSSVFGFPETTLGLIPGFGGTQRLLRAIGLAKAKQLIFSGRRLSADEVFSLGIIQYVCEADKLMDICFHDLKSYLKNPIFALQQAKKTLNEGYQLPFDQGLELECSLFAKCGMSEEANKRIQAFIHRN